MERGGAGATSSEPLSKCVRTATSEFAPKDERIGPRTRTASGDRVANGYSREPGGRTLGAEGMTLIAGFRMKLVDET